MTKKNSKKNGRTSTESLPKHGLMRVLDVKKKTGKARSTIYNWIKTGKVKSKKIGTEVYVVVESLRKFLGESAKEVGISI